MFIHPATDEELICARSLSVVLLENCMLDGSGMLLGPTNDRPLVLTIMVEAGGRNVDAGGLFNIAE